MTEPVVGATPPAAGATPPAAGATPPAAGATSPAGGTTPPPAAGSTTTPPPATTPPAAPAFKVPEEFAQAPWAQDLKDEMAVWKKLAGAEALIGKKRVSVPDAKATPDEVKQFRQALGVPETPDAYEFPKPTWMKPEEKRDGALDGKVKAIMHELNIPKGTAEKLVEKYEALSYEMAKPEIERVTKLEQEFMTMKTDLFGAEPEPAIQAFKSVVKEALGDKAGLGEKLDSLPNDALGTLMVFAKQIHDTYVGESKLAGGKGSVPQGQDMRAQYLALSEQKERTRNDAALSFHMKDQKLAEISRAQLTLLEAAKKKGQDISLWS